MSTTEPVTVEVPDIGDFNDVPVIEILVSVGQTVALDEPLVTLESDKATMDVPAPFAGVVRELKVAVGDHVSQGAQIVVLEPSGDPAPASVGSKASAVASQGVPNEAAAPDSVASASLAEPPASAPEPPPVPRRNGGPVYASPSVRRLARELGVDLAEVHGSGRKGRIIPEDVKVFSAGGRAPAAGGGIPGLSVAPWPTLDFEKYGPVERVQRTRIQRISAPNLARNWVMIPHVTQNDEADITELEAWRKLLNAERKDGPKFTMVTFLVAACVAALKEYPDFNSSLDGEELVRKRYYNIGFAADTPGGLVVPVIRDADRKGLAEIAHELTELSGKAREGKLSPGEMAGGTFTISSLGGIGGTSFTPIINAPEVAILGVTRAAIKPAWDSDSESFVPRLMVPLSLSYDHRVIDGAQAARFVVHLAGVLSDLRRALL
jgi:pyruvate dehydrogenase E2 component (dihydrolipoamide acetyltransferase)